MLRALFSGCIQEAESLYKTMAKRFRQNKAVWLSYGTFLLQQGQGDAASAVLQRALKSLPSKESKTAAEMLVYMFLLSVTVGVWCSVLLFQLCLHRPFVIDFCFRCGCDRQVCSAGVPLR